MSNEDSITILSDTNLASFRNIKEIDEGSEADHNAYFPARWCVARPVMYSGIICL